MERQHIAIRKESYVAGNRDRPEVGVFTQTHAARHPAPWGRIAPGETVWMKWSGGPIVARAEAHGVVQLGDTTADELRREVGPDYGLYTLTDYWEHLKTKQRFDAVVVRLAEEEWLDEIIEPHVPNRESWVVESSPFLVETLYGS